MTKESISIDPVRTRMRAAVSLVGRHIEGLPADGAEPDRTALAAAWSELVAHLALGEEPDVRACPSCGAVGMRMATVCGRCWRKLTPPGEDEA